MPQMKEREYRTIAPLQIPQTEQKEKRIDSSYYTEGYATTFEPYVLWEDENGPIYEKFDRSCFVGCDMSDIIMQFDHQGMVMARQRNKTLLVEVDDNGLFIAADLSKSEMARNLYEAIANGLIDRMSWGFMPGEYYFDKATRTFVHTKIKKIFDVSAVSIPANEDTNIHARSFVNGEIEKMKQELLEQKRNKEKLSLILKLEGVN